MLIDCHVHLNNYHEGELKPVKESLRLLFQEMEQNGVDHSVVLTSYRIDPHRPGAIDVIEVAGDDPRITVVEGLRWRGDKRTDLFEMEERVASGRVKGIKLYPGYDRYAINDPSLETVYRIASKHDVPVMIHTGDTYTKHAKVRNAHPLLVDDVAVDFPDVKIIMCHLGNPWFQDAAEVLYKNENVYADISGLTLKDFESNFERYMIQRVKDMIMYMGDPGRQLLYGSDWPLVDMKSYLKFFHNLEIPDEKKDNIAWKTSAQLFKVNVNALTPA